MRISKILRHAPRRAAAAALFGATLALAGGATAAQARDQLVVVITKVAALDAADSWLAGPDDFYARLTIDGEVFTTPIKRQRNHAEPNWRITKDIRGGTHNVRLEIFDKDLGKADDKIDINRVDRKRDLDFTVSTRPCRVGGFSESFRCGDPIRREGYEQKKAEIEFYVDVIR